MPIVVVVLVALVCIRDRRPTRYAALAAALALGVAYAYGNGLTVAETFHFIEYGLVALLFYLAWRPLNDASAVVLPVLAAVVAGSLDEWFQWFVPLRAGEARDVVLNAVSGVCGVLAGLALAPLARTAAGFTAVARRRVAAGSLVMLIVVGAFFQTVHVGHDVAMAPNTVFRSRYTAAQLDAMAGERAERWRRDPPVTLRRYSREDQYLAEGLWHVRRRNEAWAAGNIFEAWRENLIAERYFAPVLDTASYLTPEPARWPEQQRADAAARSGDDGRLFVSAANPWPIYRAPSWLTPLFVLKLLLVPALVVAVTLAVRRWGPAVGGWLTGLPIVAGPVLVFYGIEQGTAFAARAAQGTMAAMTANALFCVLYAWLARRQPWYVCLAAGWFTFAAAVFAIEALDTSLAASVALPVAAASAVVWLMPAPQPVVPARGIPKGDLLTRLMASGTLVIVLTALADRLGPAWSGLLTGFPTVTSTITAFTHVQRGVAAVTDFFRGFVPATIGLVAFCLAFALLVEPAGLLIATSAALAVQLVIKGTVVRWLTRPAAAAVTLPR